MPQLQTDTLVDQYFREIAGSVGLSQDEEVALAARIAAGDEEAAATLVEENLRFVVSVAKGYQNLGLPLPDLINEGNLGLMTAARRFDGSKGFKFISYAIWWIRQAILQALQEQQRTVRLPFNQINELTKINKATAELIQKLGREPEMEEVAHALGADTAALLDLLQRAQRSVSLDAPVYPEERYSETLIDVLAVEDQLSLESAIEDQSLAQKVESALSGGRLEEKEEFVLRMYFGFGGFEPMTLQEIGPYIGRTRERVRQIKEKALAKLRHPSAGMEKLAADLGLGAGFKPSVERENGHPDHLKTMTIFPKKRLVASGVQSFTLPSMRHWTSEQIASRNAKEATERAAEKEREARRKERAKRTKTNGNHAVSWVYDQDTDTAILETIDRLAKQLERAPTSYEVMWELHGQIPEEGIEKVALAADARERIVV